MRTLTTLIVLVLAVPVWAVNPLSNPDFDTDILGWDNFQSRPAVWDSRDASDSPSSGSALLTNTLGNGASSGILSQCIEISTGDRLNITAQVYQPSGQTGQGTGEIWYRFFSETSCQGTPSNVIFSSSSWDFDSWREISSTRTAPDPTGSLRIYLSVSGYVSGEEFSAHFDDIVVDITPGLIFASTFENNDLNEWSNNMP